jgi:hypothetical protein
VESYEYSISTDFPVKQVSISRLSYEIKQSAIVTVLGWIDTVGDTCFVRFQTSLTIDEKSILDVLVATHSGKNLPSPLFRGVWSIVNRTHTDNPYSTYIWEYVSCDATEDVMTISLPQANSLVTGGLVIIKKIDSTANTVTVVAYGSDLIEGSSNKVLSTQWETLQLICNGSGWGVL